MSSSFAGKTVLITGGTGSFGSTMAEHALKNGVEELRIFSRDEAKQDALRHKLKDTRVKFILGDTRDEVATGRAVRRVDLIFHAAALKQVPSAEFFPLEADKAVYPINAMGMSKALMEKTAQAFARDFQDSDTTISITRYGNVMYSRGSVIPLFISQIKSGGPLTITDSQMTRFLMSLRDSVDLVEYAFSNAKTGDLFVRKASASTIGDLAATLIDMFAEEPVEINEIGFRHGEKLFESLLSVEERAKAEDLGDYYRVPLDSRDLNYDEYFEVGEDREETLEAYTSHNTTRLVRSDIKSLLLTLDEVRSELR